MGRELDFLYKNTFVAVFQVLLSGDDISPGIRRVTHNQTMTAFRRRNHYVTSTFALLTCLREDFDGDDGLTELAEVLGVSILDASAIRAGGAAPNMHRLAFHYGFRPDETSSGWRVLPMDEEPFDAGPHLQWDARLLEYVRQVLGNPARRPSAGLLASRLDTTERRLKDALRRHGIIRSSKLKRRRSPRGVDGRSRLHQR